MKMQQQILDSSNLGLFPEVQVFKSLEQFNATIFTPKPYDASWIVRDQHNFPRFGHTNNIAALASGWTGSSDTASDYVVGIVNSSMLVFGVAVLWCMVIVGLKIVGQKKVGLLAGRLERPYGAQGMSTMDYMPLIEEEPEDVGSLFDSDLSSPLIFSDESEKKFNRKVLVTRALFAFSCVMVITSSIVFFANGVTAFRGSLAHVRGGLELVQETTLDLNNITSSFLNDKKTLLDVFRQTQRDLGGDMCRGNGLVARRLTSVIDGFASDVDHLSVMIDETIAAFGGDLQEVVSIIDGVDDKIGSTDIYFYTAMFIIGLLDVIIVSMLVVTYFSARGISNCFTRFSTNVILWPVFSIFLVLAWIFTLVFLVTSLAGSDFCVEPDKILEDFLRQFEGSFTSVIFGYVIFYTSGCKDDPVGQGTIEEISKQIIIALSKVNEFSETIMGMSLPTLQTECGLDKAAATALEGGATLIYEATHLINRVFIALRHMIECKTFNPIYTTFVHDAICVEGVDGLAWLYSTSFVMSIFAMVMITFRAGLYPVKQHPAPSKNNKYM